WRTCAENEKGRPARADRPLWVLSAGQLRSGLRAEQLVVVAGAGIDVHRGTVGAAGALDVDAHARGSDVLQHEGAGARRGLARDEGLRVAAVAVLNLEHRARRQSAAARTEALVVVRLHRQLDVALAGVLEDDLLGVAVPAAVDLDRRAVA